MGAKRISKRQIYSKAFITLLLSLGAHANEELFEPKPLVQTEVAPVKVESLKALDDGWLVDFGKAAFGTIRFQATAADTGQVVTIHLGESLNKQGTRINREPRGTVRYRAMKQPLKKGTHWYRVNITPDKRNTMTERGAVLMPEEVGEVLPFRYAELEGYPGTLKPDLIRQIRVHYPFNDEAAHFESSSEVLNDVWELCKYSIKATSFAGVYVDGDRERIPYEADAYINQLSHYCLDTEYAVGRRTLEYFWEHPTWPVEWHQHMVPMAWEEYLYTGDTSFLEAHYDKLIAKLMLPMARADGLLEAPVEKGDGLTMFDELFLDSIGMKGDSGFRILIDWPPGERDTHVINPVNSVVNAFHYKNLIVMSQVALVLNKEEDATRFDQEAARVAEAYQKEFFNEAEGVYRDSVGTDNSSIHANLFPLAFGLVPEKNQDSVVEYIQSRGMACSVYAAQYLLDGLYRANAEDVALDLLTSTKQRSWANMIYGVGSTITIEAWDRKYKGNLDWNHAWGAAPANLIPRRLMGIMPSSPGFKTVSIRPQISDLTFAKIRHPTLLGPIEMWIEQSDDSYDVEITLPQAMSGDLVLAGEDKVLKGGSQSFTIQK